MLKNSGRLKRKRQMKLHMNSFGEIMPTSWKVKEKQSNLEALLFKEIFIGEEFTPKNE